MYWARKCEKQKRNKDKDEINIISTTYAKQKEKKD